MGGPKKKSALFRSREPGRWKRICRTKRKLIQGRLSGGKEGNRSNQNELLDNLASPEPDQQHEDARTTTVCLIKD